MLRFLARVAGQRQRRRDTERLAQLTGELAALAHRADADPDALADSLDRVADHIDNTGTAARLNPQQRPQALRAQANNLRTASRSPR